MNTDVMTPAGVVPNQSQIRQCLLKVVYLGLAMTIGLPLVLLLVGFVIRQASGESVDAPQRIFLYALMAVAVAEIPAALFIRKTLLKPLPETGGTAPTTAYVFSRYLVIFNLAGACSFYGMVWYLLGGTLPEFALFAVIGLVIFRLVRPSTEFFFSLFGVRPAIE